MNGEAAAGELRTATPESAQAVRRWFLEYSGRSNGERLVGLMRARMANVVLPGQPRISRVRGGVETVAEAEELLLAAYHELSGLGPSVLPVCHWWLRHSGLGASKLASLIEGYQPVDSVGEKKKVRATLVSSGLKVEFNERELDSPAAFSCRTNGPVLLVTLNTSHAAYGTLADIVRMPDQRAAKALLAAWALLESELPEGARKDRAAEARQDWGRTLRRLLNDESLKTCIDS